MADSVESGTDKQGSNMKILMKILVGVVVVLAVVAILLIVFLNKAVLQTVNTAGPVALGVPVHLQDAQIRPFRGKLALKGFHVGNPQGYQTDGLLDLGSITVRIDNSTLFSDTIVVKEIAINGLVLTYEKGLLNSNLGALIDQLSAGTEEKPQAEGEAKEEKTKEQKPGKKVVIEKLSIAGSRMNFSVTGAAALTGGGAIPIPLPTITLTDLGKEKGGIGTVEAVQHVLTAIAGSAGTAIAGSAKLLGQGAEAVGAGALAVGEGAVDAGRAVVGGATDAGKAVVGGAVDAGKAVGGALKNLNPFGK